MDRIAAQIKGVRTYIDGQKTTNPRKGIETSMFACPQRMRYRMSENNESPQGD